MLCSISRMLRSRGRALSLLHFHFIRNLIVNVRAQIDLTLCVWCMGHSPTFVPKSAFGIGLAQFSPTTPHPMQAHRTNVARPSAICVQGNGTGKAHHKTMMIAQRMPEKKHQMRHQLTTFRSFYQQNTLFDRRANGVRNAAAQPSHRADVCREWCR